MTPGPSRHFAADRRFVLCSIASALVALAGCDRAAAPPPFHGIDITGAPYGTDFRGKAVLMFFGYTQCPDVCPTALTRAAEVKRLLGADDERLQVIFVTVDPERDTPAVLSEYTRAFDASFLGLYGDLPHTAETAKDFKVYYAKVPTGTSYAMDHSANSYVFDPAGRLRLILRHNQTARDYADDLRTILNSNRRDS